MSYFWDGNERKWKRNPIDDPWKSYREEQSKPRISYNQEVIDVKVKESVEEKKERIKYHLRDINHMSRKPKRSTTKHCVVCKKEYTAYRASSKYCSISCRVKAYRQRF